VADPSETDLVERRRRILEARDRGDESYLIEALVDPDWRGLAAESLGELGATPAVDSLLRLLGASDPHVRASAATALGKIGSPEALPRLRDMALNDEKPFVRSWAIGALGQLRDPADVELVLPMLLDRSLRVRASAARALGQLGDPRAVEPLKVARPRLLRAPAEWWLNHGIYDDALKAILARSPAQ
jgi:HEAT repeat protein